MTLETTVKSFAKINIGLSIPFKYSDNYHHIVSIFHPIDLHDNIHIKATETNVEKFSLTWKNNLPDFFPIDKNVFSTSIENNLIYKAYKWMVTFLKQNSHPLPVMEVKVNIIKNIPSPGGLGGGSSNAAAIILFLLEIIRKNCSNKEFQNLLDQLSIDALKIGADVPFFLNPVTSLVSGVGEKQKDLSNINLCGIIGVPAFGFSTKEMFSALNKPVIQEKSNLSKNSANQRPKKTLQHDNLSGINLQNLFTDYINLFNGLKNSGTMVFNKDQFDYSKGLVIRENNRNLFVNNEFLGVVKLLYPEKFLILEGIRKLAVKELGKIAGDQIETPVISSMTGSGSAVFAAVANKNGTDFDGELENSIKLLKIISPRTIWIKFCSLK